MKKNRLEGFSDGVFAIVITLLILELKLPDVASSELRQGLVGLLPSIEAYVLSFFLIGMYWVFHHHSFLFLEEVDGVTVWLNIVFLLIISFMPFPTMMIGRYPYQMLPVVIYGCNLVAANASGFIMLLYLKRNPRLASARFTQDVYRSQVRMYLIVNAVYVACIGLAFIRPALSLLLFAVTAVMLVGRSAVLMGVGRCALSRPALEN